MPEKSNQDMAASIGSQFDFYLVALTFTILAFSLQTGTFNRHGFRDFLEAASWLAFLVSGICGLWRLEYIPVIYRARHHLDTVKPPDQEVERSFPRLEKHNHLKYSVQRWSFLGGICALLIARILLRYIECY